MTPSTVHAALTTRLITNAEEWRTLQAKLPQPHVLQSWEWGEVKNQTGWKAKRYAIDDPSGELIGTFQFLTRRAPLRLPFTIGYVPKGPMVDWENSQAADCALDAIQTSARSNRCLFVKIDPNVQEDRPEGAALLQKLRSRGWSYSSEQIQFKNTAYSSLPVNGPDAQDTLMAQFKSKWRYNIRLAERRGIRIRMGGPQDLNAFYQLYAETSERDGFAIRPYSYYETVWKTYLTAQDEEENPAGGTLLLAEHPEDDEPIAGIFLFKYGQRVWYFYGASSERRRRDMPNYLLQWQALSWSLEQGASIYDWWGAPTDPDDPEDGMAGVWRFKQGFGAELQNHIGAWDWAPVPVLYRGYQWIRRNLG